MESMGNLRRTHYVGALRAKDAGTEMTVAGSVAKCRDKGGVIFADLRDTTGILQLMEKNGVIRRESVDYDARLKRLVPTQKAVQMEAQVRECARLLEQRITQGLTDAQRDQFLRTAQRMSENLEE